MARNRALEGPARNSTARRAPKPASRTQKSALLLALGLLFLVAGTVIAVFNVPYVREGATPNTVFGFGVVGCVICCLMSGHLTIRKLAALVDFLKSFSPQQRAAQ